MYRFVQFCSSWRKEPRSVAAEQLGGTIETVLETPRVEMPPATLEEARNQEGRADADRGARRSGSSDEDIRYVFFQQVSITGRVMGKGVVASFFPQVAERGYQLVYGATAEPVHRPRRQLHRLRPRGVRAGGDRRPRHVLGPALGRARRPRLLRLLRHRDRRAARRRPAPEPEAGRERVRGRARAQLRDRDRARDDVDAPRRGRRRRGRHQALLLPHPPVRGAASGAARRGRLRPADGPRHELRRPRGRAGPARAQLPLRPRRSAPRTTSPPTARSAPRSRASTACWPRSCRSRSPGVSANGHHHHFTLVDDDGNNVFHDPDGVGAALRHRRATSSAACSTTSGR